MPSRPLFVNSGALARRALLFAISTFVVQTLLCPASQAGEAATPDQIEFFEREVRPVLAEHCYSCHSAGSKTLQAGLALDSRAAMLAGGDSGESIVPGDPDSSVLIEAIRYESYEMPPKGKLADEQIKALEQWVAMGAPWPDEAAPTAEMSRPSFDLQQRAAEHWAWRPITSPKVPSVSDVSWPKADIDNFVLAKLDAVKLSPAEPADRSAMLRRLYFDLIGLPPTPDEAAEFMADTSPAATDRLVDKLLNSPHFGERWGRHWLDLVRYAESRGHEFDEDAKDAFQYRDYVIRAFNADVPYDQFVREHIAGDLLDTPRLNPEQGFDESVLGTGFWHLGEWVHSPVDIRKDESDRFDNMIDVMSKTFLGVTVACARCHDHKFDAISTADYYSLSGFLQSSDFRHVRFESHHHNQQIAGDLAKLDAEYRRAITQTLARAGVAMPALDPIPSELAESVVVNFGKIDDRDFMQNGFTFGDRPRHAGDAYVESVDGEPKLKFADSDAAASDTFWNGLTSVSDKPVMHRSKLDETLRSGRTLRTPTFELTAGRVFCRVRGQGQVFACVDSHRFVAGPLHGSTIANFDTHREGSTPWLELNLDRYIGHRVELEFTPAKDATVEVSVIMQGATKETRKRWDQHAEKVSAAVAKFAKSAHEVLQQAPQELIGSWADQRAQLRSRVKVQSQTAMSMMDGTGEDDHVLIRGNSSKPGEIEPRHFLTAIAGDEPMKIAVGSGRRELADAINAADNPLTSRVIVNRIWHHLMGRGIVPTTDDFGVLGQPPTHPELLDHLATTFSNDGRSIKRAIRRIVLSSTYAMSSTPDPAAVEADPKNLNWHHRPPRRLEGESIRDALLAISGQLDPKPFGSPVPIYLTSFMDGRGRPGKSGPMDGDRRRSIYIAVRRNFLPPFMLAFDTPTPFSTMGRRTVSNVPAQALILMNDPLVVELSKKWAETVMSRHDSMDDRIADLYQSAFARQPTSAEQKIATRFIGDEQELPQRWADLAHALVNTKEFIFLR
ncbi:PSD1 and planctomycete cytochrome C domain-containing protein [Rubripirellula reticaptiva]|uniref:Planctomycete cytochrome C n=1 Tax=Rubripirellula reticaptiva TaxID=2528013 RepID=A0A5C6EGG3_9BACT|nr:PSD1 and planctomycete cytochrome C domain-containing protein [Rubripirellula reticaptiva]TWU47888.1 Planctomycete cytochrome C [Rubripirellula reticaptiva]